MNGENGISSLEEEQREDYLEFKKERSYNPESLREFTKKQAQSAFNWEKILEKRASLLSEENIVWINVLKFNAKYVDIAITIEEFNTWKEKERLIESLDSLIQDIFEAFENNNQKKAVGTGMILYKKVNEFNKENPQFKIPMEDYLVINDLNTTYKTLFIAMVVLKSKNLHPHQQPSEHHYISWNNELAIYLKHFNTKRYRELKSSSDGKELETYDFILKSHAIILEQHKWINSNYKETNVDNIFLI